MAEPVCVCVSVYVIYILVLNNHDEFSSFQLVRLCTFALAFAHARARLTPHLYFHFANATFKILNMV